MVKLRLRVCVCILCFVIFSTLYRPLRIILDIQFNKLHIQRIQSTSQATKTTYEETTKPNLNFSTSQPTPQTKKKNDDQKPYLKYPLDINMVDLLTNIQDGKHINQKKINVHNFTYIRHPSKTCAVFNSSSHNLSNVLILVKSQPNNFHFRLSMRTITQQRTRVRMFFIIGKSKSYDNALKKESAIYDDIIQIDCEDSYRKLTFKTMMGYQWAAQFCPEAQYVLFQDDDFYINIDNLMKFLQQQENPERVFVGHLIQRGKFIYRNPRHKWYLSRSDYPFNVLPPYFPGGVYVVSIYLTKILSLIFPYVKWIPIDDVYIGIVAAKLNISLTNSELFRFDKCVHTDKIIACKKFSTVQETLNIWKQSIIQLFLQEQFSVSHPNDQ